MSFIKAKNNTMIKRFFSTEVFNFELPKSPPKKPPNNTAIMYLYESYSRLRPEEYWPISPAAELTQINNAETAAASFIVPHLMNIISGLNMIPPPIPIKPEKNPIILPIINPWKIICLGRSALAYKGLKLENLEWDGNIGFIYHPAYYLRRGRKGIGDFNKLIKNFS